MIKSKQDLKFYLQMDKMALGIKRKKPAFLFDELWKFLLILRYHEYYCNCHKSYLDRVMLKLFGILHHYYGLHLGFEIPVNTFGYGLKLNHCGSIIVNENARIGKFCDVHIGVNIGQNYKSDEVPTIGDNVWIGPGAKIFGKIKIADNIAIGANSVVNKSFNEPNITIAGIPARTINNVGNIYKRDYDT
jgi:serine O-acetyltransferase